VVLARKEEDVDLHEVVASNVADWCVRCYAVWFWLTDGGTDKRRQHQVGADSTRLLTGDCLRLRQRVIEL